MQVEALLERYEQLGVTLCEATTLFRKRDQARAWADEANAVLQKPLSEECTGDYQVRSLRDQDMRLLPCFTSQASPTPCDVHPS